MKSDKKILVAFVLNFCFSLFEFIGGLITNSVAIISDAVHDMGDAIGIGFSYFLERKSKNCPDENYTYGYIRYSVMGSLITTIILLMGSVFVICNAVIRIFNPTEINYDGMIIVAVIGLLVNFFAVYLTKGGNSLNQKSVNLHMLEDLLGWFLVLIGAVIMRFTDITIIDPILSILIAVFIFTNALANFKIILNIFLEKTPKDISIDELKKQLLEISDVKDVHHIHVRSIDGYNNYATMHVVTDNLMVKGIIKERLKEFGINHVTIEIESTNEKCNERECMINVDGKCHHHNHHY